MTTWIFLRHGQSVANVEGWLAGQLDAPLTRLGEQQAIAAREALVEPLPTRAFCSDLSRAHRTARLVLGDRPIPLMVAPRLRERDCGALQRRSVREVEADPELRQRMISWSGRPPRGESLLDVALRAVGWMVTIEGAPQPTLLVAHGALIRAVLASVDHLPRDRIDDWRPANCEVIHRDVSAKDLLEVLDELRREAALITRPAGR